MPARADCDKVKDPDEALLDALALRPERDQRLAALERCIDRDRRVVRVLRAELHRECADVLAAPVLAAPPTTMPTELVVALQGLAIAARFGRIDYRAPSYRGDGSADSVRRFIDGRMAPWVGEWLQRLAAMDEAVEALPPRSYGATVALMASSARRADLIHAARGAKVPADIERLYELRVRYYTAIDAALADARSVATARHRRAAELAAHWGLIRHEPTERWLARYQSKQVPGWFPHLLLASIARNEDADHLAVGLARALPGPLAPWLMPLDDGTPDAVLDALVHQGLAPGYRQALQSDALSARAHRMLGRMHLELALLYPSGERFGRARAHLAAAGSNAPAVRLEQALAESLAAGAPSSARDAPNPDSTWPADPAPLREVARRLEPGVTRGMAWFDAGLATLSAMESSHQASSPPWRDVTAAFEAARRDLPDRFAACFRELKGSWCGFHPCPPPSCSTWPWRE